MGGSTSKQTNTTTVQDNTIPTRLIFMGKRSVGKTSIINKYIDNTIDTDIKHTLGFELRYKTMDSNLLGISNRNSVKIQVWDIAHDNSLYTAPWIGVNKNVRVYVFDVTDRQTLKELKKYEKYYDNQHHNTILVGSKCDSRKEPNTDNHVSSIEGQQFAKKHNMDYIETSIYNNDMFATFVDKLHEKIGIVYKKLSEEPWTEEPWTEE